MVDAPALVPVPGAAAVVPPAPVAAVWLEHAEHVAEPLRQCRLQGRTLRVAGHDPAAEPLRVGQVAGLGANVEVAHHAERIALLLLGRQVALQAGQPLELVGVLLAGEGAAVGHVEVEHPHPLDQGADHPLLLAQPRRVRVGGQQGVKADLHIL